MKRPDRWGHELDPEFQTHEHWRIVSTRSQQDQRADPGGPGIERRPRGSRMLKRQETCGWAGYCAERLSSSWASLSLPMWTA